MILESILSKKQASWGKEVKISVFKTVTWRLLGTLDTMAISYWMTGSFAVAFSIGGFEVFTKMILYFIHERIWARWTK
jgi:uncharacterized membrane protein